MSHCQFEQPTEYGGQFPCGAPAGRLEFARYATDKGREFPCGSAFFVTINSPQRTERFSESAAIGWEPDINDGVPMNIRPWQASDLPGGNKGAGILRVKPSIKWTKDRAKASDRPKHEYSGFWGCDEKTEDFAGG